MPPFLLPKMKGMDTTMARPKKEEVVVEPKAQDDFVIKELLKQVSMLQDKVEELEKKKEEPKSIHKTETFNGEEPFEVRTEGQMRMTLSDKVLSMKNAIKILPPNLIKDGRHSKGNIEAICGFKVDDQMLDMTYEDYTHEV